MSMEPSIKQKLYECYLNSWGNFKNEVKNHKLFGSEQHAHLLSTTAEFEDKWNSADIRIMIFGISTNGWGEGTVYELPDEKGINQLMSAYENFYFKGGNWRYGQVFWNYFFALHEILKFRTRRSIEVIWNNVHKTHKEMRETETQHFNLAYSEVKIFDPDFLILFGKDDENLLIERLSGIEFSHPREVTYMDDDGDKLLFREYGITKAEPPMRLKKVFVTYHPNAHWNAGIKLKLLIDELVEAIG